jgi:RHS repeat-associated protein
MLCSTALQRGAVAQDAESTDAPVALPAGAHGKGESSVTSSYGAHVPLELPPPRGRLTVPLSIDGSGGSSLSKVGAGWSVSLSFIQRSTGVSRRKPDYRATTGQPRSEPRIFLQLHGVTKLMRPIGASLVAGETIVHYRPIASPEFLDLEEHDPKGKVHWVLRDASGRAYRFDQSVISGGDQDPVWFLTEISDATDNNKVTLSYDVEDASPPFGFTTEPARPGLREMELREIAYSHAPGRACAKHKITLEYGDPGAAARPASGLFGTFLQAGRAWAVTRVLQKISVWSHPDLGCADDANARLRTYLFGYTADATTQLPRLNVVDVLGKGQTDPAAAEPVARYEYGSPLRAGKLEYASVGILPLPSFGYEVPGDMPATSLATTYAEGLSLGAPTQTTMPELFLDVTGDARLDGIVGGGLLGEEATLLRNRPDPTHPGKNLLGPGVPLWGIGSHPAYFTAPSQDTWGQPEGSLFSRHTATISEWIDWNGDGRLDFVQSMYNCDSPATYWVCSGDQTEAFAQSRFWHVYLNTGDTPDGHIQWKLIKVDIGALRDRVEAIVFGRGDKVTEGEFWGQTADTTGTWNFPKYLPSKRVAQTARIKQNCKAYQPDPTTGSLHLSAVDCPSGMFDDLTTVTEWTLQDMNGDGFPDFVLGAQTADSYDECHFCPADVHALEDAPERCRTGCVSGQGYPELWGPYDIAPSEHSNRIYVFYHSGLNLTVDGASWDVEHAVLLDTPAVVDPRGSHTGESGPGACGIERWRRNANGAPYMQCGFRDVNGDRLPDYVTEVAGGYTGLAASDGGPVQVALLNTGYPRGYHEDPVTLEYTKTTQPAFELAHAVLLPGRVGVTSDVRIRDHSPGGLNCDDDPHALRPTWKVSELVDITGDGLPDYVYRGPSSGQVDLDLPIRTIIAEPTPTLGSSWWVRPNLGYGFGAPIAITDSAAAPFDISRFMVPCGTADSYGGFPDESFTPHLLGRQVAALIDFDGDGRPDLLEPSDDGTLYVGQIKGPDDRFGAHDAGQIVRDENGYGSGVALRYGSAKVDATTSHQLPYPEIVLTEKWPVTSRDLAEGPAELPFLYAFGGASEVYDSLLHGFRFTGYGRTVVMRGVPDTDKYGPPTTPAGATTSVQDRIGPSEVTGHGRLALLGSVRDDAYLDRGQDPWKVLAENLGTDGLVHAGSHHERTDAQTVWPLPASSKDECWNVEDPYNFDPAGYADPAARTLCSTTGLVLTQYETAWRGQTRPGPATTSYIETRREVVHADEYGRPTLVHDYRDTSITDDDICITTTYATSPSDRPILDSIASVRYRACDGQSPPTYWGMRYAYDNLPEGQVKIGLTTLNTVEVYRTSDGAPLSTYPQTATEYDAFGNVTRVTSFRTGGWHKRDLSDFDPFRVVARKVDETAAGVATVLHTETTFDPVTLLPVDVTSPNSTIARSYYDPHGRETRATLIDGGTEYLVRDVAYDGFGLDGGGALGRRVSTTTYLSSTAMSAAAASDFTLTTAYLDEVGRARYKVTALGADYGGASLETDYVEYDVLGRPVFHAYPFVLGQDPHTQYGTTTSYYRDGRVHCAVEAAYGDAGEMTDAAVGRYPRCTTYNYESRRLVTRVKGPNELDAAAPEAGYEDESQSSAVGWTLELSRLAPASVLERSRYGYDRLGNMASVERWATPGSAASVTWTLVNDSLGRVLARTEPGGTESYAYDEWNAVTEATWVDGGGTQRGTRNSYDGFGRPIQSVSLVGGAVDPSAPVATYRYDGSCGSPAHVDPSRLVGRLSCQTRDGNETYFGYDPFGRARTVSRVNGKDAAHRVFIEHQDIGPSGAMYQLAFALPDAGEETATYHYDSAGRTKSVEFTDGAGNTPLFIANSVDPFGKYHKVDHGSGDTEIRTYAPARRRELLQSSIQLAAGGSYKMEYLGYDGTRRLAGRRETIKDTPASPALVRETQYRYDPIRALGRSWTLTGGTKTQDRTFSYDGLGNLVLEQDGLTANTTHFYSDAADPDRLCAKVTAPTASPVSPPACTYHYDTRGSVTGVTEPGTAWRSVEYDADGRVTSMVLGGAAANVAYDAGGGVASLELKQGAKLVRRDWRYGPDIEERIIGGKLVIERRIALGDGGVVSIRRSGGSRTILYPHADLANNRTVFTTGTGAVAERVEYDPFGAILSDTASPGSMASSTYLWNGGDSIAELGVHQLGARFYEPGARRFLSRDPLFLQRGSARMHPYAFAFNDPVNLSDPTGMTPQDSAGNAPNADEEAKKITDRVAKLSARIVRYQRNQEYFRNEEYKEWIRRHDQLLDRWMAENPELTGLIMAYEHNNVCFGQGCLTGYGINPPTPGWIVGFFEAVGFSGTSGEVTLSGSRNRRSPEVVKYDNATGILNYTNDIPTGELARPADGTVAVYAHGRSTGKLANGLPPSTVAGDIGANFPDATHAHMGICYGSSCSGSLGTALTQSAPNIQTMTVGESKGFVTVPGGQFWWGSSIVRRIFVGDGEAVRGPSLDYMQHVSPKPKPKP